MCLKCEQEAAEYLGNSERAADLQLVRAQIDLAKSESISILVNSMISLGNNGNDKQAAQVGLLLDRLLPEITQSTASGVNHGSSEDPYASGTGEDSSDPFEGMPEQIKDMIRMYQNAGASVEVLKLKL